MNRKWWLVFAASAVLALTAAACGSSDDNGGSRLASLRSFEGSDPVSGQGEACYVRVAQL